MRSILKLLALAFLLLAGSARPALGQWHYSLGTSVAVPMKSTQAFAGHDGWGASLGLEHPVARAADFITELSYYRVPTGLIDYRVFLDSNFFSAFHVDGEATEAGNLSAGLRLHGASKWAQTYADAQIGVGTIHVPHGIASDFAPGGNGQAHNATNLTLGVGGGVRLLAFKSAGIFADAHLLSFRSGAETPLVPIRVGVVTR